MSGTVAAVLRAGVPELDAAVRAQTRAPDEVREAREALSAAAAEAATWVWVLDGTALPRPDALERLLAAEAAAPRPAAVLAGVVHAGGEVAPGQAPWFARDAAAAAVEGVAAGLLPVRAARAGSLLVLGAAARAAGPPRMALGPDGAALEWTARILREADGFLATGSVADARSPAPWPPEALARELPDDVRATVALLLGDGFGRRDKLRIAVDLLGRCRRGRGGVPRLAGAAASGIRLGLRES